MAKIKSIALERIPSAIKINDDNEIIAIINTNIEWHPLDLKLEMEYMFHLYIYDINDQKDIPLFSSNWDDSKVFKVDQGIHADDFIAKKNIYIKKDQVKNYILELKTPVHLKVGKMEKNTSLYARQFKVYGSLTPAISQASAWSETVESQLIISSNSPIETS